MKFSQHFISELINLPVGLYSNEIQPSFINKTHWSIFMNFRLTDIELNISDDLIERAEELIAQALITMPQEVIRNLWTCQVKKEETFEVEIQITPSKVKAYTCDCSLFADYKICEHITAGLLLVRKKIEEKQAIRAQKKEAKAKKTTKRLTTSIILEQIPPNTLHDFLRAYAKENRNFALALKARFANKIDLSDDPDKYVHLLESSINSVRRQALRIGKKGIRQISKVSEELINHAEEAITFEDFPEAIAIIQALFDKLLFILPKVEDKEIILKILQKTQELLAIIGQKDLAPPLRESIWMDLLISTFQENIQRTTLVEGFLKIALSLSQNDEEKLKHLLHSLQTYPISKKEGSANHIHFLLAQMSVLDQLNHGDALELLIEENLFHSDILIQAVAFSQNNKDLPRAKQLAKTGLKMHQDPVIVNHLNAVLLETALAEKDRKSIKKIGIQLFLNTYDFKYYDILKDHFSRSWSTIKMLLIASLEEQVFSIPKRDTIALIYQKNKMDDALLKYLQDTQSLDLLRTYDQTLLKSYPAEILSLHESLLVQYLNTHLGRSPSVKVREIVQHLKNIGESAFAKELVSKIRDLYADRQSLMEELQSF